MTAAADSIVSDGIAIIGMSGRFPGARNISEFWKNLRSGVESISFFSEADLAAAGVDPRVTGHPDFVNAGGILDGVELFDASFFGLNPREAETLDPQQRLLLECAWQAMEDAGYDPERCRGPVGVYAGCAMSSYLLNLLAKPGHRELVGDFLVFTGNDKDFLTTRVSYKLNLKGPSVAVQTACSTSLVAVAMACDSLSAHQCDMALAGGVAIRVPQNSGYIFQEGQIFSRDGHTRSFDAAASGTLFSNGVGLVVLKRVADAIEDGDCIRAVIRGTAINNDGAMKVGYAAPGLDAQAEVVAMAHALAEVEPRTIAYVEAHGTATPMGDPIEVAALTKAFRAGTQENGFCALGSVKSNVGHLDTASGVAALIKTVLALEHGEIPPTINFTRPNPAIDFPKSPFYVNTQLTPWKKGPTPRRAGVHSFGIGGTNAHAVVEEAPVAQASESSRSRHLLVLSARSKSALQAATASFADYFHQHPNANLADVTYTSQVGRREFAHRRILVCADSSDAAVALAPLNPQRVVTGAKSPGERSLAFMFPGQGTQYVNMGLETYRSEPNFRRNVDECSEFLTGRVGFDLREVLYPTSEQAEAAARRIHQTEVAELALFVFEYALAQLWMEWGIRPQVLIGQSIGEYVAACLAGVFSLHDALALLAERSMLLQRLLEGAMLAVALSEPEMQRSIVPGLELAATNGPSSCVVAGTVEAISQLESGLSQKGVESRRLQVTRALHSKMMEPLGPALTTVVARIPLHPPQIPFVSSVTGTWITAAAATDARYWGSHVHRTVRFSESMRCLLKASNRTLLEVGPGHALASIAQCHPDRLSDHAIISSLPRFDAHTSDTESLLTALGRLWLLGAKVDWPVFWSHEKRRRVPLPTYAFDRKRYWVDPQPPAQTAEKSPMPVIDVGKRGADSSVRCATVRQNQPAPGVEKSDDSYAAPTDEVERLVAEIWQKLLGVERVGIYDNFFMLGGHSMLGAQLLSLLRSAFHVDVPLPSLFEAPTVAGMAERIRAFR
ncbi:MAG: beta-ketoacyl synthase N-terminal-like domain-containing protein [Candidatus Sulfotelmatobacter sp.]